MADAAELVGAYRFLAAQKKHLGKEMARIETQLEQLEKRIGLSNEMSMDIRRESWKLVDITEMI